MSDSSAEPLTALEMARNCVRHIEAAAQHQDRDPVGAHIARVGQQAFQDAQVAGQLALVSIAEDLHYIVERFKEDDAE
jgi:triosephosphate isomerase